MKEKILIIIKPDAVQYSADIWAMIRNAGFSILTVKKVQLTRSQVDSLYIMYRGEASFKDLVSSMSSGECMIAILEKKNGIEDFQNLMGDSDPSKAYPGTIRNLYGDHEDSYYNAIHGSDSLENAEMEINLLYSEYVDL